MAWFRMYDDFLDDLKIIELNYCERIVYINLMCFLSKINRDCIKNEQPIKDHFIYFSCKKRAKNVQITCKSCANNVQIYHLSRLAKCFNMQNIRLKSALDKLEVMDLITIKNNRLYINGWGRRQYLSDYSYERVKKHRSQKRNVSETVSDNRYIDNKIKKKKILKEKESRPRSWRDELIHNKEKFFEFWAAYKILYGREAGGKEAAKAWNKIKPDDQLASQIILVAHQEHAVREWHKSHNQFYPDPKMASSWLNAARYDDQLPTIEELENERNKNLVAKSTGNNNYGHKMSNSELMLKHCVEDQKRIEARKREIRAERERIEAESQRES